ncbi:unnamed protein product [Pleuronectes platessa]|uniref:Uncharacterized protein n=1 Tax=Pleuronectes platessa TaxID=8262 RepID=A0A9N7YFW8_PLEPL|nr:unnamed protein product [Pleuronectes platessa]
MLTALAPLAADRRNPGALRGCDFLCSATVRVVNVDAIEPRAAGPAYRHYHILAPTFCPREILTSRSASAHRQQAEGYTEGAQRFWERGADWLSHRARPPLADRTLTAAVPGIAPDMPVFTGHHG